MINLRVVLDSTPKGFRARYVSQSKKISVAPPDLIVKLRIIGRGEHATDLMKRH
jgi:hypothetical protein